MSYDYNALVSSLASHRAHATVAHEKEDTTEYATHLQAGLEVFETLSNHCPMTPLLWMQYAFDMYQLMTSLSSASEDNDDSVARQTRLETLEVGLNEFPGCAILHLHYCELLLENHSQDDATNDSTKIKTALLRAISQVGSGSHRNEGDLVAQLYRLHAQFVLKQQQDQEEALASFLQRAKTPLGDANEGLMQELQEFVNAHDMKLPADFLPTLEEARRWEAKTFSKLRSCEDDVTLAMTQEKIGYSQQFEFDLDGDDKRITTSTKFEDQVLRGNSDKVPRCWMGLGGEATAKAFLQYTAACRKFQFPKDDGDEADNKKKKHQLILSVFERGIAECPTVESLWLAYLKHVMWLWHNDPTHAPSPPALKTIATRAVRNCPVSLSLVQKKLIVMLHLANQPQSEFVLDPEELLQIITQALDSKFLPLPAQALDLYVTALRVVQQRILFLLATNVKGCAVTATTKKNSKKDKSAPATILPFDEAELLPSKVATAGSTSTTTAAPLDQDSWQEIQDLCEEMKDMKEAAMTRLNKDHMKWSEGRALLQHEWGLMEQLVVLPLLVISNPNNSPSTGGANGNNGSDSSTVLGTLDKAVRLHSPPHPDLYRALIQQVLHHGVSPDTPADKMSPGEILSRLRMVRGLYQKAMQSVGRGKPSHSAPTTGAFRDFDTALACLCHDYQEFERIFGSEQSLANAIRSMQKKVQKTSPFKAVDNKQQPTPATEQTQRPSSSEMPMDVDETATSKTGKKRKASNADEEHASKKPKSSEGASILNQPAHTNHQPKKNYKVKVGHIFHKAHPFTVRISNLATETGEMDLIHLFRNEHKCGAVVHAKIQREKPMHAKGKESKLLFSRGWGLLQFEERESVEKALELHEKVQLHGHVVHVERSHVPAVGIVPPGSHRFVKKQNKAEDGKEPTAETKEGEQKQSSTKPASETTASKTSVGILAFRPRGLGKTIQKPQGNKKSHQKQRLDLGGNN